MDLSSDLGNEDPSQPVIPFFHLEKEGGGLRKRAGRRTDRDEYLGKRVSDSSEY